MDMPPGGSPEPKHVERELGPGALATDEPREDEPGRVTRVPPAPPPLFRRASGKVVAGVAGGLADRWELPAWLVRAPFALAAFLGALMSWNAFGDEGYDGVFGVSTRLAAFAVVLSTAYVVLWWLVPREDVGVSPARRSLDRFGLSPARRFARRYPGTKSWPGLALLALGGALLADQLEIWNPNVAFAFALIALGVALYRREPGSPPSGDEPTRPAGAATPRETGAIAAPAPRPPRERSPLGWITFGTALLVISVSAIVLQTRAGGTALAQDGTIDRISSVPALGLLVLAVGLLVSSVFGRARWLVLPALLLTPAMLLASVIRLPLEGRYGDTSRYPRADGEVAGSYRTVAGRIFLDLSRLAGREDLRDLPIQASSVVGDVTIVLPYDASWRARGYVGLGNLGVSPAAVAGGTERSLRGAFRSTFPGGPSFVLDVEAGIGNVSVLRSAPTREQRRELERQETR